MSRLVGFVGGALGIGLTLLGAGCCDHKDTATAPKIEQGRAIAEKEQTPARANNEKAGLGGVSESLARQNEAAARKSEVLPATPAKNSSGTPQFRDPDAALAGQTKPGSAPPATASLSNGAPAGEPAPAQTDPSGAIKITLAGSVLFDPGKAELKSSGQAMLLSLCQTIKSRYPDNFIRVEGHTDSTPIVHSKGKYPDNMALSIARASSVCKFMVDEGGIQAQRLHTAGYGEFRPLVDPEISNADKAKNRRVEVVILPQVSVRKEALALDTGPAAGLPARIPELRRTPSARPSLPGRTPQPDVPSRDDQ